MGPIQQSTPRHRSDHQHLCSWMSLGPAPSKVSSPTNQPTDQPLPGLPLSPAASLLQGTLHLDLGASSSRSKTPPCGPSGPSSRPLLPSLLWCHPQPSPPKEMVAQREASHTATESGGGVSNTDPCSFPFWGLGIGGERSPILRTRVRGANAPRTRPGSHAACPAETFPGNEAVREMCTAFPSSPSLLGSGLLAINLHPGCRHQLWL